MAAPLASRVMTKAHLKSLSPSETEKYINHHVRVAGVKKQLVEPAAITAIHQGSAGGLRRANELASRGLMAAVIEKRRLRER
jgi:type II secretory pathway predicted ATPase ExeA